jgi:transcriptional regulator with XRE-family HTH domain
MEQADPHATRRVVARNLVRLRRARGLTQERLAVAAGIRQAQISEIEAGKISVGIDSLERIAQALGVPFAELFQEAKRG